MTDLERALAAGAKPVESDLDRALKAGAKRVEAPPQRPKDFAGQARFMFQHPVESLEQELSSGYEGLKATADNALNGASFGAYRQLRDARSPKEALLGGAPASEQTQATERFNEEHPFTANATSTAGAMAGGPRMIAEGVGAVLGGAARVAPKSIANVLRFRPTGGVVLGGATAGTTSVADDLSRGAPLDAELAKRAGRATAMGAVFGGAAGTVGGIGSRTARAIRDPRTGTGRAIADIEAAGGRTKALGAPVRGGVYDTPEFQALPEGKAGINELGYTEGQKLTAHNEEKLSRTRQNYGRELSDTLSNNSDQNHFLVDHFNMLDNLEAENTINGVTGDPHLAQAIDEQRRMLTKEIATPRPAPAAEPVVRDDRFWREAEAEFGGRPLTTDAAPGPRTGNHQTVGDATNPGGRSLSEDVMEPPHSVPARGQRFGTGPKTQPMAFAPTEVQAQEWPAANVEDLVKVRRLTGEKAEWGLPATPQNRPYRMLYGSLTKELEAAAPEIADLNHRYAGTMRDLERTNDVVYGSDTAEVPTRAAKERRAAQFLGRIGDETQAGTAAEPQIRELAEQDPAYAEIFNRMKAKKAQERLRYGSPKISMSAENLATGAIKQNLDAATARIGLPIAEALGRIGPSPLTLMSLPEAMRAAQEAKRKLRNR